MRAAVRERVYAAVAVAPDASTVTWQARKGWTREFGRDATVTAYERFDSQALTLETPDYVRDRGAARPSQMNYLQLRTLHRGAAGQRLRRPSRTKWRCTVRSPFRSSPW